MTKFEFEKKLVGLVRQYLNLPEDTAIQQLNIDASLDTIPVITCTLIRIQSSTEKSKEEWDGKRTETRKTNDGERST